MKRYLLIDEKAAQVLAVTLAKSPEEAIEKFKATGYHSMEERIVVEYPANVERIA